MGKIRQAMAANTARVVAQALANAPVRPMVCRQPTVIVRISVKHGGAFHTWTRPRFR